ncbi:MAG: 2-oxoglutarate dehydrogenase complex dihydrolipoyllysine-residue succinyltransferase [Alistipes senegalensis]|nr:2-oxoglutarate dehydrogenase complex dihydrolipoyllysine-residue succinyltransferase [Oxalobacter formigenes]MCM1280983.1 2-oxoglutarate dehydrogenase complex dihydrolipoyllysine-residue succinyltransferase [Alistipes senegalensis]
MAVLDVKVPQLSESVTEAALLTWHKKTGEMVEQDENLVDIETDKVVLELPCPGKGVLTEILKEAGAMVKGGEVIARVDTDAVAVEHPPETGNEKKSRHESSSSAATSASPSFFDESAHPAGIVMPSAARLMAENDLECADVKGTGKGGRILKEDVLRAMEIRPDVGTVSSPQSLQSVPYSPPSSFMPSASSGNRPENRVPMSRLRARIAERLIQSQLTNATLTTFNEVNMQPVLDIRRKLGKEFEKEHGVRLGLMSFFMKAAVAALKKFPVINASIDGNDIVYHGYFDIGIAISSPRGLVVPIMRDVDLMSLADIEKKIAEFSARAKEGLLTLEDLTGGTFSISNGGVFGSMMSTPIINPPQSAILGIHATRDRPVVEDGQIVIRPMNYLALSYDHRLIDGSEAVQALVAIKENLEEPSRLLLDL